MRAIILTTFALSLFFVSCKDEKKAAAVDSQTVTEKPFTVTVNAVVTKDDIFQIFYNEDGAESFAPDQAITIQVKGNGNPQDLVFTFPEEVMPASLRFDIGGNKEQKEVALKGVKIDYYSKSFSANGADFMKYFYGNTQVEFDTLKVVAKIKLLDGEPYDPILGSTPALKLELAKLYKK